VIWGKRDEQAQTLRRKHTEIFTIPAVAAAGAFMPGGLFAVLLSLSWKK
jgi:hypothetical protein